MAIILGGGIGGLSAAHYLLKAGKKVSLLEATDNVGGWIQSVRDPKTGIVFEKGPRTIRIKGNVGMNTLLMVEELKLAPKIKPILVNQPSAKNRLIHVNNQLYYLPSSLSALFKKIPPFSNRFINAFFKDLFSPVKKVSDDNIFCFVERRFGHEFADFLVSSMVSGICAGDAKEISVKFLMPYMFEAEQKYGSVTLGLIIDAIKNKNKINAANASELTKKANQEKWTMFGFEGGMASLPLALKEYILFNGGNIHLNSLVKSLSIKRGIVKCTINGKDSLESEHIFCTLPAKTLAPLLKAEHPTLYSELSEIPFVDVAVVNLAYKGDVIKHDAFGFLVPPSQGKPVLGVIFDSCNFPVKDFTVLTVMMGGRWFTKYFGREPTNDHLLNTAVSYCKEILGVTGPPVSTHTKIMRNCIPQYVVGHYDRINRIFSYIKEKELPISLIGSSYSGIGVNDVILSAKNAVLNHV